ncbi:MAG: helix-turn-helix transcriptional regulator [Oscillospiraceae bacterium]|nr:helix-turn-helix transcriptional regulator [Clostridia bacterium]MBQ9167458.1 helix-turn-helix transcriptional regulator [Oscillospiraceae bacterium]
MGDRNVIGHNITRIRQEKNMGQGELVRQIQLLGVEMNQAKLSRIEGKKISVVDKDMIAIAEALGVTVDELCK